MTRADPILELQRLSKTFRRGGASVCAVDDVSFALERGTTTAIVGPSGSGKSTLARIALALLPPDRGSVLWRSTADSEPIDLAGDNAQLGAVRRELAFVFQQPRASFDPRLPVRRSVAEPLIVHRLAEGAELDARVDDLLAQVGVDARDSRRFPHQLSVGQLQRAAIARALAAEPKCLVLDEPTSALDASIQAQVLNLLVEIAARRSLSYLFITHDLSLVRYLADRAVVLSRGRAVEHCSVEQLFDAPEHPATRELIAAWRAN